VIALKFKLRKEFASENKCDKLTLPLEYEIEEKKHQICFKLKPVSDISHPLAKNVISDFTASM
jgi:hypothetical protein